jgi:EAL domain-containing protein (putative c-di-GMP-specific phosphodiesterase class I)
VSPPAAQPSYPEPLALTPALFIPLAEKLGLMDELTQLTLRLSLRQQRAWAAEGWSIPVSVNAAPSA